MGFRNADLGKSTSRPYSQFAAVNQPRGNVWFLAGNSNGGTTVRAVTIAAGKALFFPVANTFDVEDGIVTGVGTGGKVFSVKNPLQTAQALVAAIISTASTLSCEVDGVPVAVTSANLEQSNPFALQLPTDNIVGVPRGVYYPAVDSGYYVLIPPLSRGQHMIRFSARSGTSVSRWMSPKLSPLRIPRKARTLRGWTRRIKAR